MSSRSREWIGDQTSKIIELKTWPAIRKFLLENDITDVSQREVFDMVFPDRIIHCENARFERFSVGYQTCKKGCDCYQRRLSEKMKAIKWAQSPEEKEKILHKRINTVQEKYGVSNVFQLDEVKTRCKKTKLDRYGNQYYRNDAKREITNIQKYGFANPLSNPEIHQIAISNTDFSESVRKVKETKLKKYGHENFNNSKKRSVTNQERYGTANAAQSDIVRKKISKNLIDNLLARHQETYNITPMFANEEYSPSGKNLWKCNRCDSIISGKIENGRFTRCMTCHPHGSMAEIEVKDFIKALGIEIVENSRQIIPPLEIDIYIPSHDVAIEYCGNYWHSEKNGKDKHYHQNKLFRCHEKGIRLITLFSDTWENKREIVESRLRTILGINSKSIYARRCRIELLDSRTSNIFLDNNHIQGGCKAPINLGLTFQGEIVSVMSFSKSRFEKARCELVRFASKMNLHVPGGASKLLAFAVKNKLIEFPLVTYSDNQWGFSESYTAIGFTKISSGTPGYCYINLYKDQERLNRLQFQKHRLHGKLKVFDPAMTEYENMLVNGYDRIWDCGHSKFQINEWIA